jgi:ubiquinone/menaquinone biosynthesis C-methylase UbiE
MNNSKENTRNKHTKKNLEEAYYGYSVLRYFTAALIAGGIVSMALAIVFTAWSSILCLVSGTVLLFAGVFCHLSMGWVTNRKKIELLKANFSERLKWAGDGKVLDIGTGQGRVAIGMAKQFPEAQVTGVDTWAKSWKLFGMTKAGAARNAVIESVSARCTFQTGSALDLPFAEGEFQLVVSAFVFHEVRIPDRTLLLKEAIRVLAPGGVFVICDLFNGKLLKTYNVKSVPALLETVRQMGAEEVKYESLEDAGVNLGGLAHIWELGYLSGRKV